MDMSGLPTTTELHHCLQELEMHIFRESDKKPGLVGVALFLFKARKNLEDLHYLKGAIDLQPRRSIEKAIKSMNAPRSSMFKFIKDMGLSTDDFCAAVSDDELIEKSPALLGQMQELMKLYRQYIGGDVEPNVTEADNALPTYML